MPLWQYHRDALEVAALAELATVGLAEARPADPDGPSVFLSSLGRHRSGRKPPDECDWTPGYWSQAGDADAVKHVDALPVPRALEAVTIAEHTEALIHRRFVIQAEAGSQTGGRSGVRRYRSLSFESLSRPRRLLGTSIPWSGAEPLDPSTPCPVCLGRDLESDEFCRRCSRWGLDGLVPLEIRRTVEASHRRRIAVPLRRRLAGGTGR
ncbi:MAG TPA: hypothetical protein VFT74_18255, partial [Isosphaeraceae bacterium]|nr:hypothetical protein [Isosphaeraceae bacterium]